MKKLLLIFGILVITSPVSFGSGDFFRFDNRMMNNNRWYRNSIDREIENTIDEMNRQTWTNPYDIYNNPVSRIFKKNDYTKNSIKDSDIEYLLSKMERNCFGKCYNTLGIENRLDRLEAQMFGAIQSGDYKSRLNRLRHAYSAESTRSYKAKNKKLNRFKEFFSNGYPTSIPADEDYYSSLRNGIY